MNSGVADAMELGWKLAAVCNGWGGEWMLPSYECERRPVMLCNRNASGTHNAKTRVWTKHLRDDLVEADSVEADWEGVTGVLLYSWHCSRPTAQRRSTSVSC